MNGYFLDTSSSLDLLQVNTRIQCYVSNLKAICDKIDNMQREIDELTDSCSKIRTLTKD